MSKFNSIRKIWPNQFSGFWLLYRKEKGSFLVIFSLLLPIRSLILMLKTPKLPQRWRPWIEFFLKILKIKFFENFGQNWPHFDKKCHFLQKCDLFKISFCVITLARMKLETWNLVNVCRKKFQKTYRSEILNFLFFLFLLRF